jgi:hypothetical protein
LAGGVGEGFDPTVIFVSAPIKGDLRDAQCQCPLGDEFPDFGSLLGFCQALQLAPQFPIQRGRGA